MARESASGDRPRVGADENLRDFQATKEKEDGWIEDARDAYREFVGYRREHRVGLALSGGGIRSATFCLGVLQALAKKGRLAQFDYLSTVSGGGYIGSWLSAWIHWAGFESVMKALASQELPKGAKEAPEVTWLRRYSNYLSPRLGLFSGDSLSLITTWLRNVLLNLVILTSFLAVVFLVPRLLLEPTIVAGTTLHRPVGYAAAWMAFVALPLAIGFNLTGKMGDDPNREILLMNRTAGVLLAVIVPGLLTALLGSVALFARDDYFRSSPIEFMYAAAALLVASAVCWLWTYRPLKEEFSSLGKEGGVYLLAYVGAIVSGALVLSVAVKFFEPDMGDSTELAARQLTFGVPSLLVSFGVVGSVFVGLVGSAYSERSREWWSRMNAWFVISGFAWLTVSVLSFYALSVVRWSQAKSEDWAAWLMGASWLGGLLASLVSPKPSEKQRISSWFSRIGLNLALIVVVVGILLAVSSSVGLALEHAAGGRSNLVTNAEPTALIPATSSMASPEVSDAPSLQASAPGLAVVPKTHQEQKDSLRAQSRIGFKALEKISESHFSLLWLPGEPPWIESSDPSGGPRLGPAVKVLVQLDSTLALTLALISILLLFGLRVDVNKFSLHSLYKNRLARCYLGASRQELRTPHPFTGFDEADDIALHALRRCKDGRPARPLHIVNAALNITQGKNLAWQERKAASFTLTPEYCGFALGPSTGDARPTSLLVSGLERVGGYRPTELWASKGVESKAFSLGSAMAVSGAAVSTNSGMGSSAALAFVGTFFNARLGRWSPNPLSTASWRRSSPAFGLLQLLRELFGYSNEGGAYLHLSDGGHFDNTGAYELVRRECRTIVLVDASADPGHGLGDLANFIRKVRIDFGVSVVFESAPFSSDGGAVFAVKGYEFGTVTYKSHVGRIVVLKPTVLRSRWQELDVASYSRTSPTFPHQTTVDQFFTESQFESYRALGERIAGNCIEDSKFGLLGLEGG